MRKLPFFIVFLFFYANCGILDKSSPKDTKTENTTKSPSPPYHLEDPDSLTWEDARTYLIDGDENNQGEERGVLSQIGILKLKTTNYDGLRFVAGRKFAALNNVSARLREDQNNSHNVEMWYLTALEFLDTLDLFQQKAGTSRTRNDVFYSNISRIILVESVPSLRGTGQPSASVKERLVALIHAMGQLESDPTKKPIPTFPLSAELIQDNTAELLKIFLDRKEQLKKESAKFEDHFNLVRVSFPKRAIGLIGYELGKNPNLGVETKQFLTKDREFLSKI